MTRHNIATILAALLVVVVNGLIDHFFAPAGIVLTPPILATTTALVTFVTKELNPIVKCILVYILVAINDILIKLYGGGMHDNEGLGWIHLLLFIGLVPTFGLLATSIIKDKGANLGLKIVGIAIFPCLIFIHLHYFADLGLGRYYKIY